MQAITVTIGRNVNGEPMAQESWNEFASTVRGYLEGYTQLWLSTPYRGSWDGTREDAMIFYGAVNEDSELDRLRVGLSNLATYYQQDAIGLTVGQNELVSSFDATPTR